MIRFFIISFYYYYFILFLCIKSFQAVIAGGAISTLSKIIAQKTEDAVTICIPARLLELCSGRGY